MMKQMMRRIIVIMTILFAMPAGAMSRADSSVGCDSVGKALPANGVISQASTIAAKVERDLKIDRERLQEKDVPRYADGTIEAFISEKLAAIKNGNFVVRADSMHGPGVVIPRLTDDVLARIYSIIQLEHLGQKRKDVQLALGLKGTDYVAHILGVVAIAVNELGMRDPYAIIAAFLHDTIEDSINYAAWTKGVRVGSLTKEDARQLRIEMQDKVTVTAKDRAKVERQIRKKLRAVGLRETELDAVFRYVHAMTKKAGDDLLTEYFPGLVNEGANAMLLKLADRIYNMRDTIHSTVPGNFELYMLGDGTAAAPGTLKEFLETPMGERRMPFVDNLPEMYDAVKVMFRREAVCAFRENTAAGRLSYVNDVPLAEGIARAHALVMRVGGFASFPGAETFTTLDEVWAEALRIYDAQLRTAPSLTQVTRHGLTMVLYTDLPPALQDEVGKLWYDEVAEFNKEQTISFDRYDLPAGTDRYTRDDVNEELIPRGTNIMVAIRPVHAVQAEGDRAAHFEVVGMQKFRYRNGRTCVCSGIFVKESARKKGYARILRTHTFEWLYAQGYERFEIDYVRTTERSQALHRHLKAHPAVTYVRGMWHIDLKHYVTGEGATVTEMRRADRVLDWITRFVRGRGQIPEMETTTLDSRALAAA